MSFHLRVDSATNLGRETCIRGCLSEGAYFGPQYIRLKDTSGREWTATIVSHGLLNPQSWPVTAEHDTELELYITTPEPGFAVDTNSLVEGLGHVLLRRDSTDLTGELFNPLFWANFSVLHMDSESMENPYDEFLGLTGKEVNRYYTDFLLPRIDSVAWPIFMLEIDSDRYVEMEWVGGAEYQDRVWIGAKASGHRALLGYNSGHFSLPGLRPNELVWLLDRLQQSNAHPAAGLLLVSMCYLPEPDSALIEKLTTLCARIPHARVELARTVATNMVEHLIVPKAKWEHRPDHGWCSNWDYSQRNPQSPMSVLSPAGFKFVEQFFSEAEQ